jgi:hypothetical protein
MKKFFFATALLISITSSFAQNQSTSKTKDQTAPAASRGFWVIESNINVPHVYVVHFYDSHNQLIYQENVAVKKIDISRRKTQKQLNEILDKALANYAVKQAATTDMAWVAATIRK